MSKASLIFRNFSLLTVGKVLGDVFTFVFFVIIARQYGDEGVGQFSLAIAISGFTMVLADFGLRQLTIKELSRRPEDYPVFFGRVFLLRILLSALSLLFVAAIMLFSPFSLETKLVILVVGVYQAIYTLINGLAAVSMAHEDMYFASMIEFLLKTLVALCGSAVALTSASLLTVVTVMPVLTLPVLAIAYRVTVRRYGKPEWNATWSAISDSLRHAFPYGITGILQQISMRSDVIFLGYLTGEAAAGIYNIAYRLVFLLLFMPYFLSIALLPTLSQLHRSASAELGGYYQRTLNLIMLIGIPASAGLWLIGNDLITLIYGPGFEASGEVMAYLAWLLLLECVTAVVGAFLVACDQQRAWTAGWTLAAVIGVVGNLALIPLFGVKGAAVATLLAFLGLAIHFLILARRIIGPVRISPALTASLAGTAAFCVPFMLFPAPMAVVIPASAAIYAVVMVLSRKWIGAEIALATRLLKGGGGPPI